MARIKDTIIAFLIVLTSFFYIDVERSMLLISSNIEVVFSQEDIKDIDIPHQYDPANFNEDDKWLESLSFDFSCFNTLSVKFLYTLNMASQELPDSVWQPPKFV